MEKQFNGTRINGFLMLFILFIFLIGSIWMFIYGAQTKTPAVLLSGVALFLLLIFLAVGLTKIDPNDMRVMVFSANIKARLPKTDSFGSIRFWNALNSHRVHAILMWSQSK